MRRIPASVKVAVSLVLVLLLLGISWGSGWQGSAIHSPNVILLAFGDSNLDSCEPCDVLFSNGMEVYYQATSIAGLGVATTVGTAGEDYVVASPTCAVTGDIDGDGSDEDTCPETTSKEINAVLISWGSNDAKEIVGNAWTLSRATVTAAFGSVIDEVDDLTDVACIITNSVPWLLNAPALELTPTTVNAELEAISSWIETDLASHPGCAFVDLYQVARDYETANGSEALEGQYDSDLIHVTDGSELSQLIGEAIFAGYIEAQESL